MASQSAQKVAGAKRLLPRPLATPRSCLALPCLASCILSQSTYYPCLPATSAGKMQYRMHSPFDPSPWPFTHNKDHTKRTELQSQGNTTKKSSLQQQQQQQQANSERFSIKRNCCSMWILCLLDCLPPRTQPCSASALPLFHNVLESPVAFGNQFQLLSVPPTVLLHRQSSLISYHPPDHPTSYCLQSLPHTALSFADAIPMPRWHLAFGCKYRILLCAAKMHLSSSLHTIHTKKLRMPHFN